MQGQFYMKNLKYPGKGFVILKGFQPVGLSLPCLKSRWFLLKRYT